MNLIHIEHEGRSARVGLMALQEARPKLALVARTSSGPVSRVKLFSCASGADPSQLTPQQVIDGNPELDLAQAGRRLDAEVTAAYFDPTLPDLVPVGEFREVDIVTDVNGQVKERRPHLIRPTNINTVHPLKLSRRFSHTEAFTSFVFRHTFQLVHEDRLAHDFLYAIAKDLHEKQEVAFVGGGPKGILPLVVRERATPSRAFLFGEIGPDTAAQEYKLLLLLSDQELKKPAPLA